MRTYCNSFVFFFFLINFLICKSNISQNDTILVPFKLCLYNECIKSFKKNKKQGKYIYFFSKSKIHNLTIQLYNVIASHITKKKKKKYTWRFKHSLNVSNKKNPILKNHPYLSCTYNNLTIKILLAYIKELRVNMNKNKIPGYAILSPRV